ncbi:MAG: thioredoxin domain-containing protein [Methylobacteriaceae bacterium]|nr:thioredoxin domain-containing protein [Methylobacteriaceae bacterium]
MTVRHTYSKMIVAGACLAGIMFFQGVASAQINPASSSTLQPLDAKGIETLNQPSPLGDIVYGNPDAKVTVVEFSSITCSHCAAFAVDIFPRIKKDYIDTGKIKFIFRDLAFDSYAVAGYALARCQGNDKFPEVVDYFFKNLGRFSDNSKPAAEILRDMAFEAGIPKDKFTSCLGDLKIREGLKAVRDQAGLLDVNGTPSFFINGKKHVGDYSYDTLKPILDKELGE